MKGCGSCKRGKTNGNGRNSSVGRVLDGGLEDEFRLISAPPFKMARLKGKSFFLGGDPPFSSVFMGK